MRELKLRRETLHPRDWNTVRRYGHILSGKWVRDPGFAGETKMTDADLRQEIINLLRPRVT